MSTIRQQVAWIAVAIAAGVAVALVQLAWHQFTNVGSIPWTWLRSIYATELERAGNQAWPLFDIALPSVMLGITIGFLVGRASWVTLTIAFVAYVCLVHALIPAYARVVDYDLYWYPRQGSRYMVSHAWLTVASMAFAGVFTAAIRLSQDSKPDRSAKRDGRKCRST